MARDTPTAVPAATATRGGTVKYAIDIRFFIAAITASMALAFGVGVAFGPDPSSYMDSGVRMPTEHVADLGHLPERHVNFEEPTLEGTLEESVEDLKDLRKMAMNASEEGGSEDKEEHLPAGQHLLMDIKGVDSDFLNSEERLAQAMVDAVKAGGLTLLSYHCHALPPAGVSCVGVLLESHISFHTWPEEGVITLDLFTCGSSPLLPVVPVLEKLFGVGEDASSQWGHELRGFRHEEERRSLYLDNKSDLSFYVLSALEMTSKEMIVSTKSPYQHIDIWDTKDVADYPSYEDGIKAGLEPGDPRWLTNEVASPDRLLFLDGNLQSLRYTEQEYHESLVHPAMFAHPGPKHVAIVGGGEGATLREVLKHNTLESVTMIEIDEMLIEICREHLPTFSNCSDMVGRADNCFDDNLATIVHQDGRQWFVDRYDDSTNGTVAPPEDKPEHPFDVVILDALAPEEERDIADKLYSDRNFLKSVINSMSDVGVLAIQVGAAPGINDPRPDMGVHAKRHLLFNMLESLPGVAAMFVYEEAHCGFDEPRAFLVACKSTECRSRWYAEADAIDYQIYDRIVRTKSKERTLVHFDGSTQLSFQVPPKAWETVYCRREPMPFECDYRGLDRTKEIFEFDMDDEEKSAFRIEATSEYVKGKHHTTVYANVDIPKGSYIMAEHLASSFMISDASIENLEGNVKLGGVTVIEDLLEFIDMYGHESLSEGSAVNFVEVGASYMIRRVPNEEEANVGRWMPNHPSGKRPVYSPVYERRRRSFDLFLVATKDIKAGEELLKPENLWEGQ